MSDLSHLRKNSIGIFGLIFQSLTAIAPLMDMIALITTAAIFALASMPLAFLLAFILTFLTINTIFQFSKKIASSGGYYSFVGHGLGPRAGLFTGWIYLLYTTLVTPNAALFFGAIFVPAAFQLITGMMLPAYSWIVLSLVLIMFVAGMSYWGIKPSLKYSIITGLAEISIMIFFSVFVIAKSGTSNTLLVFTPKFAPGGMSGVALGMIFSITSFAGSGSPVILGEEAKGPRKTIGKAVIVSVLLAGVTILLSAYALAIGWGTSDMSGFGNELIPGVIEARTYLGLAGATVIVIFGINSFLNLGLSYFNAGIRGMYAMARDGVILPKRLSSVNLKHGTPHVAIAVDATVAVLLSVPMAFWLGPFNAFVIELTGVTVGYLIVHILANISLSVFFRKIGEFNIVKHLIIPFASTLIFLVTLYYSIVPIKFPVSYGVLAVFVWAAIGGGFVYSLGEEKVKGKAQFNLPHERDVT